MEYPESLYEVINYNNTSILLPKTNKKSYSTVLIWLTGMEELSLDYIQMFNYNENILPHPEKNKIIIINGEKRKITAYKNDENGEECNSWFDVYDFDNNINSINYNDLKKSGDLIKELIEKESKILGGYNHIYLGGFSQGACLSLYIGLEYEKLLGGIIACSGVLFPKVKINKNNKNLRIFLSHGDLDDQITKDINEISLKPINNFPNLEVHYYSNMGHFFSQEVLVDLSKFFNKYM